MTGRTLRGWCALATILVATAADARTGRCVLQVNGRSYLNGPCDISTIDRDGSFSIGTGKHRAKYFAYVTMDTDGAEGFWNETPDASHAHSSLGMLHRAGACWVNSTAKVCAYR